MILQTLTIRDFGPFFGTQRIEFAVPDATAKENVTVIHGSGGSGKTSIVRALRLALFGNTCLPQDRHLRTAECHLVNLRAPGAANGQKEPVAATVELVFRHWHQLYTVRRTVVGRQKAGAAMEEPALARLEIRNPQGRTDVITDPQAVAQAIGEIIGPLARHVLFDAEEVAMDTAFQDSTGGAGKRLDPVIDRFRDSGGIISPSNPAMALQSSGQKYAMAMAHALAQLKASAEEGGVEFPFITDDPLSTLDARFQEHVIRMVPEQCNQWILLTSCLDKAEADLLRAGGRWGRFYRLRTGNDGSSRIENEPIDRNQ